MKWSSLATTLVAAAVWTQPAQAATVVFEGSRQNVDAPGPASARCGSRATTNIRNTPPTATSSGTSNLGSFTPTMSHCIQVPLTLGVTNIFDLGQFTFDFGDGDSLLGTYSGTLNPLSPGLFAVEQTHIVTGGTGSFAGWTGSFLSTGTLDFRSGRPTAAQTFAGTLVTPAVPEPATWALLVLGFGAIGAAMRRTAPARTVPALR